MYKSFQFFLVDNSTDFQCHKTFKACLSNKSKPCFFRDYQLTISAELGNPAPKALSFPKQFCVSFVCKHYVFI